MSLDLSSSVSDVETGYSFFFKKEKSNHACLRYFMIDSIFCVVRPQALKSEPYKHIVRIAHFINFCLGSIAIHAFLGWPFVSCVGRFWSDYENTNHGAAQFKNVLDPWSLDDTLDVSSRQCVPCQILAFSWGEKSWRF